MTEDKAFIQQLKEGNENAWRMLIDEYKDKVLKTALSYIPFSDDAEDVAQDVFIEVFKSIGTFRQDSSLSTWIFRITVNKALNVLRKNKKQYALRPIEEYEVFEPQMMNVVDDASVFIQQKEQRKIIQQAIQQLPERQAMVFVMHKIEGRSYKEISELLDITISSVESLMFRAKNTLQEKLIVLYQSEYK